MKRSIRRVTLPITCLATLLISLVAGLLAQGQTVAKPWYIVTNLGTLGGTISIANGINNRR
jgi:hypothetical protein